jgi:hypothetical protein
MPEVSGSQQPQPQQSQSYQPRPPQPAEPRIASGLAMIEPEDTEDSGPIETPEGRSEAMPAPAPRVEPEAVQAQPEAATNGTAHPAAEELAERPKRPRRRRPKSEATEAAPAE